MYPPINFSFCYSHLLCIVRVKLNLVLRMPLAVYIIISILQQKFHKPTRIQRISHLVTAVFPKARCLQLWYFKIFDISKYKFFQILKPWETVDLISRNTVAL